MTVFEHAETVVMPVCPEMGALKSMHALLDYLSETGSVSAKSMFVLNNLFAREILKLRDIETALGQKITADLPYDPFIYLKAINEGVPVVIGAPKSQAAERLAKLSASAFGEDGYQVPRVGQEVGWPLRASQGLTRVRSEAGRAPGRVGARDKPPARPAIGAARQTARCRSLSTLGALVDPPRRAIRRSGARSTLGERSKPVVGQAIRPQDAPKGVLGRHLAAPSPPISGAALRYPSSQAGVAELAYAADLKPAARKGFRVRISAPAPSTALAVRAERGRALMTVGTSHRSPMQSILLGLPVRLRYEASDDCDCMAWSSSRRPWRPRVPYPGHARRLRQRA